MDLAKLRFVCRELGEQLGSGSEQADDQLRDAEARVQGRKWENGDEGRGTPLPREDEADVRRIAAVAGASMAWGMATLVDMSRNSALVFFWRDGLDFRARPRGRAARERERRGKGAARGDAARTQRSGWSTVRTFQTFAPLDSSVNLTRLSRSLDSTARLTTSGSSQRSRSRLNVQTWSSGTKPCPSIQPRRYTSLHKFATLK